MVGSGVETINYIMSYQNYKETITLEEQYLQYTMAKNMTSISMIHLVHYPLFFVYKTINYV